MDAIQSFRFAGQTDIHKIACSQVKGQYVIFLDDIKDVFGRVERIKDGDIILTYLRDEDGNR